VRSPATLLFLSVVLSACQHAAPVLVGGNDSPKGCIPAATNPSRDGESLLAVVRSGPGTEYRQIDVMGSGDTVFLCGTSANGEWSSVVYSHAEDSADCRAPSAISPSRRYHGPCKSGWVVTRTLSAIGDAP